MKPEELLPPEFPAGAIENGRAFADRLENDYSFECEAGPLKTCVDWQEFRRCFECLAEWVSQQQSADPVDKSSNKQGYEVDKSPEKQEYPKDQFRGDNAALASSIRALLDLDAKGALVPNAISVLSRLLLSAAAERLDRSQQSVEPPIKKQANDEYAQKLTGPKDTDLMFVFSPGFASQLSEAGIPLPDSSVIVDRLPVSEKEQAKTSSDEIDIEDVRQYLESWGCLAHPGVRALLTKHAK
ncbi:MAG: hypothetical protein CML16_03305 [Pusillimonas sp.]|nr:hypothetical protein [Pusillimonas sp.]MBC43615.1 hypothetical protein [Pusillimonas sp.]HCP79383.1 hypothetical protein [Pusillimonas sp.]|tara:strand:- start:61335 stop:62057 length:723 start_codon:yes stop_codon:yes gene_type:complete